jgi:hypothetical protein
MVIAVGITRATAGSSHHSAFRRAICRCLPSFFALALSTSALPKLNRQGNLFVKLQAPRHPPNPCGYSRG